VAVRVLLRHYGFAVAYLAGVVAAIFLVAFFAVFWLRARSQRKKGL